MGLTSAWLTRERHAARLGSGLWWRGGERGRGGAMACEASARCLTAGSATVARRAGRRRWRAAAAWESGMELWWRG